MRKTALLFSFFLSLPFPANGMTVEHDFSVTLGMFDAGRTLFSYALSPENYSVNSEVSTAGVFDTLYPFKATYATNGKIRGKDFETASYKYQSQSRFSNRSKELIYNEKGIPVYRISSKNGKQKKAIIDQTLNNKDTTDLQTVLAKLAKQYNDVKFCDSRMEVFDGKRRFSVIFKDEGAETLPKNKDYPLVSGSAAKCSMYIDKLNSKDDDLLWELTSQHPVYFWIIEDPKTKAPFIAKISVEDTPLGQLEIYAKEINIKE